MTGLTPLMTFRHQSSTQRHCAGPVVSAVVGAFRAEPGALTEADQRVEAVFER